MHVAQFVLSPVTVSLYKGVHFLGQKATHLQTWVSVNILLRMNWRDALGFPLRWRVGGIYGVFWIPAEQSMTNERLCCVLILLCHSAFEPHLLFILNKAHISHLSPLFQETCSGPFRFVAWPERLKSFPEEKILFAFFRCPQYGLYLIRDREIVKASNTTWVKAKNTASNRSSSDTFLSRYILKIKYFWPSRSSRTLLGQFLEAFHQDWFEHCV